MNSVGDEKIFTKPFFLIFGELLFSALVMYVLMSTVTEYATSMGTTATIAGLVSGICCNYVYCLADLHIFIKKVENYNAGQVIFSLIFSRNCEFSKNYLNLFDEIY